MSNTSTDLRVRRGRGREVEGKGKGKGGEHKENDESEGEDQRSGEDSESEDDENDPGVFAPPAPSKELAEQWHWRRRLVHLAVFSALFFGLVVAHTPQRADAFTYPQRRKDQELSIAERMEFLYNLLFKLRVDVFPFPASLAFKVHVVSLWLAALCVYSTAVNSLSWLVGSMLSWGKQKLLAAAMTTWYAIVLADAYSAEVHHFEVDRVFLADDSKQGAKLVRVVWVGDLICLFIWLLIYQIVGDEMEHED